MPLSSLVTLVADRLAAAAITDLPPVDGLAPATAAEVPHVTVSVADAQAAARGLGEVPGPPQTGALRVAVEVDLADPVLRLAGETVELLSADRRTLQLPHGAVVRADGTDSTPFAPADLLVRRGATTFTPTHQPPAAGEVQLTVESGVLTFATPLPATGAVTLGYFVGLWEIRVERFAATLLIDIAHDDPAEQQALTTAVEAALARDQWPAASDMRSIAPVALSAALPLPGLAAGIRSQRLTYRVDVERIDPVIRTSGGPIVAVDVPVVALDVAPDGPVAQPDEAFTVERGTSP